MGKGLGSAKVSTRTVGKGKDRPHKVEKGPRGWRRVTMETSLGNAEATKDTTKHPWEINYPWGTNHYYGTVPEVVEIMRCLIDRYESENAAIEGMADE